MPGGDVYADVAADPEFGHVSLFDLESMTMLFGDRGGDPARPAKRHVLDPLLWRAERGGEPSWDGASLGRGRPGWHIECSVIARDGLGLPFDVQGGGADLLFPHHEMSTSHARLLSGLGADGAPRVHVHAGLIAYQGAKMSKSLGNLVFVSGLLREGTDPMAIRLALLGHHYREEWEWVDADLERAEQRLAAWRAAVAGDGVAEASTTDAAQDVVAQMRTALADDLDAPTALAAVDAWAAAPSSLGDREVVAMAVDALLGVEL